MQDKRTVLLVEDSTPLATMYLEYLRDEAFDVLHVGNGADAKSVIAEAVPDVILLDIQLPDISGQDILRWIKQEGYPCTVVVITGNSSVDLAVEVMQDGARDFLEKPISANRLLTTLRNHLEHNSLEDQVRELGKTDRHHYHGFIGSSLPMQAVYRIIDAAAPSKATVFITGESGTGKEVCAEAIHKQGERRKQPFIALNCGAIPRDLMESEIFGHVKGAFTGASSDREGAAMRANGGTLFLDEIGEMDMDLQTKLLRFVQTGTFQKVGGSKEESVDVRFVCATNRDPLEAVAAGTFREDLYYRLHVVPLHLPPLRDRNDDVMEIAQSFLQQYASEENKSFRGFSPEVDVILRRYNWPGNVRQLQNVLRNIVVLHDDTLVQHCHLPPPLDGALSEQEVQRSVQAQPSPPVASETDPTITPLAEVERNAIEQAIALCDGNIPKAAALLDVSPSTIYRKKQSWDAELE